MPDQAQTAAPSAPDLSRYTRTEVWTYIGQRLNKGKLLFAWMEEDGSIRHYPKQFGDPTPMPGARFRFKVTDDGHFGIRGAARPEYIGVHENEEEVARWRLLHEADRALYRERNAAKADMSENKLNVLLRPIKEEYERRNWEGKAALIAVVIRFITGGRI